MPSINGNCVSHACCLTVRESSPYHGLSGSCVSHACCLTVREPSPCLGLRGNCVSHACCLTVRESSPYHGLSGSCVSHACCLTVRESSPCLGLSGSCVSHACCLTLREFSPYHGLSGQEYGGCLESRTTAPGFWGSSHASDFSMASLGATCQARGITGSVLGLVVLVSVYYGWVRQAIGSAASICVGQHVSLSPQAQPGDVLSKVLGCLIIQKQPQTHCFTATRTSRQWCALRWMPNTLVSICVVLVL